MTTKISTSLKTAKLKRVNSILVSQPPPPPNTKNAFNDLETKYNLKVDYRAFNHVEGVSEKEFRKLRIRPDEYNCVIFNSKHGIENFFRLAEEMRMKISPDTKYFCLTESVANYLQKFIHYRKRKVFVGNKTMQDISAALMKHKNETFLVPISNLGNKPVTEWLTTTKLKFQEAEMYRTVSSDLSDLSDIKYDMLAFFSPQSLSSLFENFPDFVQEETRIAAFGKSTCEAVEYYKLRLDVAAPQPDAPSMPGAIEKYLLNSNK
ncbi:MAG TPA: uroporphyrinogen-III synthase [Saprospiraceae bacterium]|jgi:uroporphyrinogen-III synthase|nr:MAG: uroporphyrinogen III synthase HEM4 [Candidatus Parvibacillus calidus]MBX2937487.1 uroporphyrinogen-III synthase [Saprospiraceae bacterium]MBK7741972.1 uroporphyrinogen-III synthase [Candidatus Parvibacillus calidus]MBX7178022.1 uroporphyrinogen-III synthase [Saprospiraceae bacterium]MCB0590879.1 uroporphyrinogen-III synthase [Saprospiraceae bacterium]